MSYVPPPPHSVAPGVIRGLAPAVAALSKARYGAPLHLRLVEDLTLSTAPATVRLNLAIVSFERMRATLTVRHVGGNVYDMQCIVADDPTTARAFTYCLPDDAASPIPPDLVHKVAPYLLDTIERLMGRALLRQQLHRTTGSNPSSLADSTRQKTSGGN